MLSIRLKFIKFVFFAWDDVNFNGYVTPQGYLHGYITPSINLGIRRITSSCFFFEIKVSIQDMGTERFLGYLCHIDNFMLWYLVFGQNHGNFKKCLYVFMAILSTFCYFCTFWARFLKKMYCIYWHVGVSEDFRW